jgi:hypothetical protein
LFAAAAALIVTAAGARTASAQVFGASGAGACNPLRTTPFAFLFSANAVNVNTDGPDVVDCGAVRLTTSSPSRVFVDVRDGNNASGITCTTIVKSWNGLSTLFTSTSTTSASFVGSTFFEADIPSNITGYITVECTLPADGSSGFSWVAGMNVQ